MPKLKSKTFHGRLREARNNVGLSLVDVEFEIRQLLPKPLWVGYSTLSRLETKTAEEQADPFLIGVLARIYGVPTAALSEVAEACRKQLVLVVSDFRCNAETPA